MFKKALNFTQLKTSPQDVDSLQNGEALQLVHRGSSSIKVIITQEYFLDLVAKANLARHVIDGESVAISQSGQVDSNKIMDNVLAKGAKMIELLEADKEAEVKSDVKRAVGS